MAPPHLPYVDPRRQRGLVYRLYARLAGTRVVGWLSRTIGWKLDPYLLRLTRGRVGFGLLLPTALLETRGARTGQLRRNGVIYFHDGERVTIIASKLALPSTRPGFTTPGPTRTFDSAAGRSGPRWSRTKSQSSSSSRANSPMPHENVELVRRGYRAYNAGDLDTLYDLYDPDVVMFHLEGWPEPGPSVGRDAVFRELEQLREAWREGDSLEPIGEPTKTSNHVLIREVWKASGEGPDAVMAFTTIFTLRKGKVITIQRYWDHAEALEAVGLSE